MASLRNTVKDYQDELKDGIAWVAFWREGRSWNADYFYLEPDDAIQALDRSRMEEIREADPAAVMLNSYYCGHLGEDMNLDELAAGVRWHYENGYNQLSDFLEAELLGVVLEDEEIIISQNHGEPVIGKHTVSDTCYQNIARRIAGMEVAIPDYLHHKGMFSRFFWRNHAGKLV